jgi:hypothetical protein
MLLALLLVAGCNRDEVETNNPPESATVTSDTATVATDTIAPTETSATAPMAATGNTVVTPTDTSSTVVTTTRKQ